MMRAVMVLGVVLGAALASPALAQAPTSVPGYLQYSGCPGGVNPCFVQYGASVPVTGTATVTPGRTTVQGTLTASNSSALFSTLTLSPGSAAWTATPAGGVICIQNQLASANNAYVCMTGTPCTAGTTTNGMTIEPGVSRCRPITGVTPSVISDGTSYLGITE